MLCLFITETIQEKNKRKNTPQFKMFTEIFMKRIQENENRAISLNIFKNYIHIAYFYETVKEYL